VVLRIHYVLKIKQTERNNKRDHYSEQGYCPGCFKHWTKEERVDDMKKMRQNIKQNHKERKTLDEAKKKK
jgi:hypothetical protein